MLIPYKRHCAETIENIIIGKATEVPCDDSTINKIKAWWSALLPYFLSILESLSHKLNMIFTKPILPKEIVRAVTNSNLWVHTRSVSLSI